MERRELLAAVGVGIAGFAGCLEDSTAPGSGETPDAGTDEPPDSDTDEPTDSSTDAPAGTGTVRDVLVTPEVVALDSPDSIGTFGSREQQYVVATVVADGSSGPAAEEFALTADGETYAAGTEIAEYADVLTDRGRPYSPAENPEGWIAVQVPKPLDVEEAAITWPDGERALGEEALARLRRPPTTFEVRSFDVPETAAIDETITVPVTVENRGDAAGTFVGALNLVQPLYAPEGSIRLDVPAGETGTWEREFEVDASRYPEGSSIGFRLKWRDDSLDRTVEVRGEDDA